LVQAYQTRVFHDLVHESPFLLCLGSLFPRHLFQQMAHDPWAEIYHEAKQEVHPTYH
jgi:hypothetical protein